MDTMKVNPFHISDIKALKIDGVEVTATAAEINKADGVVASMTTTTEPGTNECAVQLVFKDEAGETMAIPTSGLLYLCETSDGLAHDIASTSLAVLTNGALTNLGSAGPSLFTTTAAGLLGMTIAGTADQYFIVIVLPSGKMLISDECAMDSI